MKILMLTGAMIGFSLGIAVAHGRGGHLMSCLVYSPCGRRGFYRTADEAGDADVHFWAEPADLPGFWRGLFTREGISEREFFDLAEYAFPALVFHPALRFGAFDGSYPELRDRVVQILGGLNDHLATALAACHGLPHQVGAAMGKYGVDLSPESPNTRSSPALMRKREVVLDGATYRCEWHAKLERHRNRIHITLPEPRLDGRVLVGIFVSHLDT